MKLRMCAVVAVTACALQGCAAFSGGKTLVVDQASTTADEVLATAKFAMCRAITVGAWVREYGNDAVKAEAWRTLCKAELTQTPAQSNTPAR